MNKQYIQVPLIALILTGCSTTKMPDQPESKSDNPHALSEQEEIPNFGIFYRDESGKIQPESKSDNPRALSEQEEIQKREEILNELYERQFELIKAGKSPMPLPMTPELKTRLEDEGIPIPDRFKE